MRGITHYKHGCQGPLLGREDGRRSYRWRHNSQAGLIPERCHYNLNNATTNKLVEVTFVLCPGSIFFKGGITGSLSRNSSWLIFRQCELGHADDRRGNRGVGKYWSGNSQETLPYLHDMPFKSLPVPPSESTRMNTLSSHSFCVLSSVVFIEQKKWEDNKIHGLCSHITFLKGVINLEINFFSQINTPHSFIFSVAPFSDPFHTFLTLTTFCLLSPLRLKIWTLPSRIQYWEILINLSY